MQRGMLSGDSLLVDVQKLAGIVNPRSVTLNGVFFTNDGLNNGHTQEFKLLERSRAAKDNRRSDEELVYTAPDGYEYLFGTIIYAERIQRTPGVRDASAFQFSPHTNWRRVDKSSEWTWTDANPLDDSLSAGLQGTIQFHLAIVDAAGKTSFNNFEYRIEPGYSRSGGRRSRP